MIEDILLESKKQYQEKLEKLIAERDEIIEKKCEELRETLKNVRNPEIDKLVETIKAFDELIEKERVKDAPIEEVVEEKPISVEEIKVYEDVAEETKDDVIEEPAVEEIVEEAVVEEPIEEVKEEPIVEEVKEEVKEEEVKEEAPKSRFTAIFNMRRR